MVKLQQRRGLSRAGRQFSSGAAEQGGEKCAVVRDTNGALSVKSSFNPSRVAKSKGWCNAGERHGRRGVGYDARRRPWLVLLTWSEVTGEGEP